MSPIELTEERKSKLLEMCNKLFPEKEIRFIKPVFSCPDTFFIQIGLKSSIKYDLEIHWFEFCMIHLVNKVLHDSMNFNFITEEHESLITGLLRKDLHPVDYLYEEFKKLK